jgi:hypothetical protein
VTAKCRASTGATVGPAKCTANASGPSASKWTARIFDYWRAGIPGRQLRGQAQAATAGGQLQDQNTSIKAIRLDRA